MIIRRTTDNTTAKNENNTEGHPTVYRTWNICNGNRNMLDQLMS